MGEAQGQTQKPLECNIDDRLCVVLEHQYEVIIIPTLLVGAFIILLLVILWLHFRGQRAQRQQPGLQENIFVPWKEMSVNDLLRATAPALVKLQLPRDQITQPLDQICQGSLGPIYRTTMNVLAPARPKTVVLKTLRDSAGLYEVQDFLGRIQFHHFLGKHKHLVQLLGCCTEQLPLYMVLEDVAQGDLLTFLWTCRRDVMTMDGLLYDLTEKQIYHIGSQVLTALEYLQSKRLFHGDLAARNVLLQSDLSAKLCGLGLAYEVHARGAVASTRAVPLKWLAPERLLGKPAGIRADVWSFGILLYEMVTLGAPPYPEVPPANILQHLQRKQIMQKPASCTPTMYSLMKSCWRWSEEDRPAPTELRRRLEATATGADDKAVLQVPELVVPSLYADVAGIPVETLSCSSTAL